MKYFKKIQSLDDLKKQFRELAKENHPDVGGDGEVMKAINNEYDRLFPIWKHRYNNMVSTPTVETADSTRSQFYTENGWQWDKYDKSLFITDIAKNIRTYAKEIYPTCKFSITTERFTGGSSMCVVLREAPQDVFVPEFDEGYKCLNEYHLEHEKDLNEYGLSMMSDINEQIKAYHYEDSDPMTDYFRTNFYYSIYVGECDREFKVVEKTARMKAQENSEIAVIEDNWVSLDEISANEYTEKLVQPESGLEL